MSRESRGARGKVVFFLACLAVGVAAVVAVSGLSTGVDAGLRREAKQLLAADLAVTAEKPIPAAVSKAIDGVIAAHPGSRTAVLKELATVVAVPSASGAPGASTLVEMKAVGAGWPFYGAAVTAPPRPLDTLLGGDGVLVGPELAAKLHLDEGSPIKIGGKSFVVRGRILSEPDSLGGGMTLGPRLLTSIAVLDASGLETFGSRLDRKILVKLEDASGGSGLEAARAAIEKAIPENSGVRVETYTEAQPRLRDGFKRATSFVGLVALVSLILGGIGVAQTVRAWLASRVDAIAILKCLGVRPREIVALYATETAVLGLSGSVAGAALGTVVLAAIPSLLAGVLPSVPIDAWQPWAVLRGVALGTGVALVFSVAPLSSLRLVSPLRVLRRDADPLRAGLAARVLVASILIAGVFGAAWIQSGSPKIGAAFACGMIAAAMILAGAAMLLTRAVARLARERVRVTIRHGLAALARPNAGTLPAVTALGLGVLVVVGIALVQRGLIDKLRADLPKDAPNVFLVDMQAAQWPSVRPILETGGATGIRVVPIVNARLVSVDGVSAADLAKKQGDEGRGKWIFTREQNLTYMQELPKDNTIVEGKLWSDPKRAEISLEKDYARDLGAKLGSRLVFDVQGISVDLTVTSLRTVDWKSFGINFFLVVEPGVLDAAPQMRVAAARIPAGREQELQDRLAAAVPNVTMLKVREIVEKVAHLLDRLGLAIRILGGFAVAAGIAILAGAVGATAARRGRDVALLKTLGATRAVVVGMFAVEFALVGLVAGIVGSAGGTLLAWAVLTRGMDLEWSWHPLVSTAAPLATVVLTVIAGIATSAGALRKRPIEVLRSE
jgi:putative ABC transport system permease protein